MATRRPDPDTLAAIRLHWDARHEDALTDDQIALARKGRIAEATKVTFTPETTASPAWFTCLSCPPEARRYRVDVGADPLHPPARHVAAIQRHVREKHGVADLPAARIYHDPAIPALATYVPSTPLRGAQVICTLCPEGNNHISIENPPRGDARSLARLVALRPGLVNELTSGDPTARANRLEAHHRKIQVAGKTDKEVAVLLKEARRVPSPTEPSELTLGLLALMGRRAGTGMGITRAIAELLAMMDDDPVGYACQLAGVMPGLERYRGLPPDKLAEHTRDQYGPLERTERTLWAIWDERPIDPPPEPPKAA